MRVSGDIKFGTKITVNEKAIGGILGEETLGAVAMDADGLQHALPYPDDQLEISFSAEEFPDVVQNGGIARGAYVVDIVALDSRKVPAKKEERRLFEVLYDPIWLDAGLAQRKHQEWEAFRKKIKDTADGLARSCGIGKLRP